MKKFKILPSILMLTLCVAILGIGVFAIAPTQNTISGSITINSANPEVIISAYHHNEDGSLNTESPIIENVRVRSGIDINFGSLTFDTSKANTEADLIGLTQKITIRLQNPGSTRLGVYFSEKVMAGQSTEGDVLKTKPLTTEDDQNNLVSATLKDYLNLPEKSGETNGIVETTIKFNLLKFSDSTTSVNLSKPGNKIYLNVEECNTDLAPTLVGTTGIFEEWDMTTVRAQINYGVTRIGTSGYDAFYWNGSLTSVDIPSTVTTIGVSAFENCVNLTSVDIPSSVTTIMDSAFAYCDGLIISEIPSSVTSIGSNAFWGCNILKPVKYEISGEGYTFKDGTLTITSAITTDAYAWGSAIGLILNVEWTETAKAGTTIIPASAFVGCYNLTSIEIPSGVTSIGGSAFSGCRNLTSIEILGSLTSIGELAFRDCYALKSVKYETSSVDYIFNDGTLIITSTLTEFTEPGWKTAGINPLILNVEWGEFVGSRSTIPQSAFSNSYNLTNIVIPGDITIIGSNAFDYCYGLDSITIKPGVDLVNAHTLPSSLYRKGYTFKGWYDNAEGTGTPVTEISANEYVADTTYYTVWTEI